MFKSVTYSRKEICDILAADWVKNDPTMSEKKVSATVNLCVRSSEPTFSLEEIVLREEPNV